MKSLVAKRSIVAAGHKTSVSLEDAFWEGSKDMDSGLSRTKDPGPQVQHSAKVAARPFIRPSHTLSGLSVLLTIPHSSV